MFGKLNKNFNNKQYMRQTKQVIKKAINADDYVNLETGETLTSEHGNVRAVQVDNGDFIIYKSNNFTTMEKSALEYLKRHLSVKDIGYIHLMLHMVYGSMNALYTRNMTAHTRETLMKELELARTQFSGLITRLIKIGVLYELKGLRGSKITKTFILNPNVGRAGSRIDRYTSELFKKF